MIGLGIRYTKITGIENKNGATNERGKKQKKRRMEIIERTVAAVVGAQKRIDDGTAAAPSTQQESK